MGNQGNGAHREKSRLPSILGLCIIICALSRVLGCTTATRIPTTNFTAGNDHMANMIKVTIGVGDFGVWANDLYAMDPVVLPIKATFFIPSDDGIHMHADLMSSILQYHIIQHQISYYYLQCFEMGMRLHTMLSNQTILVTRNCQSNYTLDDVLVMQPEIFNDDTFTVHGIVDLLKFTRHDIDLPTSRASGDVVVALHSIEVLASVPNGNSNRGSVLPRGSGRRSDGSCLCKE